MSMNWFDVLKAARNVGSEVKKGSARVIPFTAAQLADEAGFKATEHSRSTDIAAGWISKLVRWGYVRRVQSQTAQQSEGGRPQMLYELTKWGLSKKSPKRKYWQPFDGTGKPTNRKTTKSLRTAANPEQ